MTSILVSIPISLWAGPAWGYTAGGHTAFQTKDSIVSEVLFSSPFMRPTWLRGVSHNAVVIFLTTKS